MKKFIFLCIFIVSSSCAFTQNDVTKFLGIPVDGYKQDMIQKLKAKGFHYNTESGSLSGEFNGRDVNIHVVTNNNKVYRIMLVDANFVSEGDIKIRFNNLCHQFDNNPRYMKADISSDYKLPEDEDISYEMTVHNKRYEAVYYQINQPLDSVQIAQYVQEQIGNDKDINTLTEDQMSTIAASALLHFFTIYSHNSVWFTIQEFYGKYSICMYYDNEYNKANGEDL